MTFSPVLIDFGFLEIRYYGLILSLSVLVSFIIFKRLLKIKKDFFKINLFNDDGAVERMFIWVVIGGVIGGRLAFVLSFLNYYLAHPLEIFAIWQGGIAFYGVFFGGLGALIVWVYIKSELKSLQKNIFKENIFFVLDLAVICLALGQSIGRWGNYFNQELFGFACNFKWCLPIDYAHRPVGFENFTHFHPVFLYESILMFLVAIFLYLIFKRVNKTGFVFFLYLILHGVIRFIMEFYRIDPQGLVLGLRSFQFFAGVEILIGIVLLMINFKLYYVKRTTTKSHRAY